MSEAVIVALLGFAGTLTGAYLANKRTSAVIAYRLEALEKKVDRHNSVVERTYKLETDTATAWKRHDELAERVERLEDMKIGGTQ